MQLAQNPFGPIKPPPGVEKYGATIEGLGKFIANIVILIIIAIVVASLVMLLIGSIQWITSGGDPKAVGPARSRITAAIVGLTIALSTFAIIRVVEILFGISILSLPITIPGI